MAPSTCVTCRLVSRTVRGPVLPELIKLLKAKAAAATEIPAAAQRFATRIDEKPPTLTFSGSDMSLAESLFGRGKMAPPTLFDELTREYLFLPQGQNEALTKSVQLEKMFLKFKPEPQPLPNPNLNLQPAQQKSSLLQGGGPYPQAYSYNNKDNSTLDIPVNN